MPDLDIDKIDYNDQDVLDYIGTGKTDGIFQIESAGMKSFMKELKPHSLEDIIAGISLYRPGPMDFIPQYIKGKNKCKFDHIRLPAVRTDPCADLRLYRVSGTGDADRAGSGGVYARAKRSSPPCDVEEKGGCDAERAPDLCLWRRRERRSGMYQNGIDEKTANKIYDEMIDFAKYAFNKSHAAAYAVVAYQTAFLKYYYPVEFMAALMTSVIENPPKVAEIYLCMPAYGH